MAGYTNGDGNFHDKDRREQWYDNKQLFEMLQLLSKEMIAYRDEMRKYNGLKEDNVRQWEELKKLGLLIKDNEDAPCKKLSSWDRLNITLTALTDKVEALTVAHEGKKQAKDMLITWGGWVVMITGFILKIAGWW